MIDGKGIFPLSFFKKRRPAYQKDMRVNGHEAI